MTTLPQSTEKKLGLVIDLDTCVGCHACVINCKEWNTSGYGTALSDQDPYGANPTGAWLNRIHTFEVLQESQNPGGKPAGQGVGEVIGTAGEARVVHFPKSCLHCEDAPCVTVCPTGASYKRAEDGIVLVDEDMCIGCGLCAWSCAYGAREMDLAAGVMKKCTLCVDRIYNEDLEEVDRQPACVKTCPAGARHFGDLADPMSDVSILVKERGGFDLMPEQGNKPVNKYLPPRQRTSLADAAPMPVPEAPVEADGLLGWVDRLLSGGASSGKGVN
ncbi:MAG: 4Fe-4S dicluster domain-containing protein [Pseudomonadota bacterium]